MKILHVSPLLGPANGGSAIIPLELAKQQAVRGHQVTVVSTDHKFDERIINASPEITIVINACSRSLRSAFYSPAMRTWLKENVSRYDIVHIHNLRSHASIIVHRYATQEGVPYVVQAHGSAPVMEASRTFKKAFDLMWTKGILADSSGLIAVTSIEIEQYVAIGASRPSVHLIPNALDLGKYDHLPERGMFRKQNGISSQTKVVLYLGRLNRRKAIDILIRAFEKLSKERDDVTLIICGPDDGNGQELRDLVADLDLGEKVKFIGFVDDPISAYIDADMVACPSRNEIFGLVPFEAIMSGTPVVVSNDSGCGEIVKDAGCGLIVPTDDVDAVHDSMVQLLDDPGAGRDMVARGREYIKERFSWSKVVLQFDTLYREVIASHERR